MNMNIKTLNLDDDPQFDPIELLHKNFDYAKSDLIVLETEKAPLWYVFEVIKQLRKSGAGAIGVPESGKALVVWSNVDDVSEFEHFCELPQPNIPLDKHLQDIWEPFRFFQKDIDQKERTIHSRVRITRNLWKYRKLLISQDVLVSPEIKGEVFEFACMKNDFVKATDGKDGRTLELWNNDQRREISFDGQTFSLTGWSPEEVRTYVSGEWFEEYVFTCLSNARSRMGLKRRALDFACNPLTDKNEIDVVAYDDANRRYYIFECKARKAAAVDGKKIVSKLESVVANLREKIKNEREIMGIIVWMDELRGDSSLIKAVHDSQAVACIHGSFLKEYLEGGRFLDLQPGQDNSHRPCSDESVADNVQTPFEDETEGIDSLNKGTVQSDIQESGTASGEQAVIAASEALSEADIRRNADSRRKNVQLSSSKAEKENEKNAGETPNSSPKPSQNEKLSGVWEPFDFSRSECEQSMKRAESRKDCAARLWDYSDLLTNPRKVVIPEKTTHAFQTLCKDGKIGHIKALDDGKSIELFFQEDGNRLLLVPKKDSKATEVCFDDFDVSKYFSGKWFGEYVFLLLKQAFSIDDKKKRGVELLLIPSEEESDFDVVAYVEGSQRYYLLKCQSRKSAQAPAVIVSDLEECVEEMRKKVGKGRQILGIVVFSSSLADNSSLLKAVRSSSSVACIHGERLKDYLSSGKFLELEPGQVNP